MLSAYLAQRVRHLHVVETDAKLEPVLREALADGGNATLVIGDVMELRLGGLDPLPEQGGREPALRRRHVRRSCARSTSCRRSRTVVRDGAARDRGPARGRAGHEGVRHPLRAGPARLRGGVRAPDLAQRVPAGAERRLRARAAAPHRARARPTSSPTLVRAAFAHRRKALPRSLEEAGGPAGVRAAAREALEEMGHPPDARAETLSPARLRPARARAGALRLRSRDACAGEAQPLPLRRAAPPRRAARDPLGVPADHAGRRGRAGARPPAARTRSSARASRARTSRRAALAAFRDRFGWDGPPVRVTIEKHIPVVGGTRRRLRRRRRRAAAGRGRVRHRARRRPSWPTSRCRSAPTSRRSSARAPRS